MAQTGSLGVRAFTSRAQLPVADATVVITQKSSDGKHRVLSLQRTDANGNIRPVRITAPPTAESTRPSAGQQPYSRCDIWVEHPEYELMLIEDVQIFPGEQSLQLVELDPLVAGESWGSRSNVRVITGQNL
ncbi:MAG: spore cortex-lytic protein [Oscillospiraceae bacterium]|nr:spore cortex-lytic protein [Oscillospiraceae bacterium]